MARIAVVETVNRVDLPAPVIRVDLAWTLFWEDTPAGALPEGGGEAYVRLARWLWESLGRVTGFNNRGSADTVWVVAPPLEDAARELLTRLLSFWSAEVHWVPENDALSTDFSTLENRWLPPVRNVYADPDIGSIWDFATERTEQGENRFLMPVLGVSRVFMKVQVVNPGNASVELHSHSVIDEHYLVLSGHGTLRMASHSIPVGPGSLIAKPSGPDLSSQILADQDEPVVVLDIEAYATPYGGKDVCVCPDDNLMILQGTGWRSMIPLDAMHSGK